MDLSSGSLDALVRMASGIEAKVDRQSIKLRSDELQAQRKVRRAGAKQINSKSQDGAASTLKRHARASHVGLLSMVKRSAYQRLRTGLQTFGESVADGLESLSLADRELLILSVGPNLEISIWLPWQVELVSTMLEVAVSDPKRLAIRAPLAHIEWGAEFISRLPWALPIRASSQLPAIPFGNNEGYRTKRVAILIDDGSAVFAQDGRKGFTFNRSEFITALTCVISCTFEIA